MDGKLVPGDLLLHRAGWRNFFENPKTVQFVHRLRRLFGLRVALWHDRRAMRRAARHDPCAPRPAAVVLVLVQAAIGIGTLVMQVPLHGADHQAFALVVWASPPPHWRGTKRSCAPRVRAS